MSRGAGEEALARGSRFPAAVVALVAGGAGIRLVENGGRGPLAGGILLLVVALAAAGVLLGGVPYGPEREPEPDLSARLALGLVGGFLGAVASGVVVWCLGSIGVMEGLGVELTGSLTAGGVIRHLAGGMGWGLVLGVLLPSLPGRDVVSRSLAFSLIPALYTLLKTFPIDRGVGWFGSDLGPLTFLFVFLYTAIWAFVAASVFSWGTRTNAAPLDEPLSAS